MTTHRRSRHSAWPTTLRPGGLVWVVLAIALSAAFAANPIGAVLHAWVHTAASSDDQGKTSHHGHGPCELCAAYAALEQTGLATPLTSAAAAPDAPLAVAAPADTSVRTQFAYRPRAPPHLLCTI